MAGMRSRRGGTLRNRGQAVLALLLLAQLAAPPTLAGPQGEQVVKGAVDVRHNGSRTRIEASDRSIIQWDRFDIGQGEKVRFVQPGRDARVLNRVMGPDASRIEGILRANGQVYIANPAGIFFGGRAVVDATRLVAVAGSLSNDDFASGRDRFALTGPVENQGLLHADSVVLAGARVANGGEIQSRDGSLLLAAGDELWLTRHGSHLLVRVDGLLAPEEPAVEQSGVLDAGSGRVKLAAGDLLGIAVREGSETRGRHIAVRGGDGSRVDVAGTLDASDRGPKGRGGTVRVRGDEISLAGARLDASGRRGGGDVSVGGRAHGAGQSATDVSLDADSELRADATRRGDGGSVVVWADDTTQVDGEISARGGPRGGDGGFVETSGRRHLGVSRAPDLSAPAGEGGTWLLDPANVEIVATVQPPVAGTDRDLDEPPDPLLGEPDPNAPRTFQPVEESSQLSASVVAEALAAGTDVIITTDKFLKEGTQKGNITVSAPIVVGDDEVVDRQTDASLTMLAANHIRVNEEIRSDSDLLSLGVNLLANDNSLQAQGSSQEEKSGDPLAFESGNVLVRAPITTRGGDVQLRGVDVLVNALIDTGGGNATVQAFNPVGGGSRRTDDLGTLTIRGTLRTTDPDDEGDGTVNLQSGGLVFLEPGAEIDSGDGQVSIEARRIKLQGTLTTSGAAVGLGLQVLGSGGSTTVGDPLHTKRVRVELENPLTTEGGTVALGGDKVLVTAPIDTTAAAGEDDGDVVATGGSFELFGDIDAGDASVVVDGRDDVTIGDATGVALDADSFAVVSGSDGSGSLTIAPGGPGNETALTAREVVLSAGDGTGGDGSDAAISLGDARITLLEGDGADAPPVFSLVQDASIADAGIPDRAATGADPGLFLSSADLSEVEMSFESADGGLQLDTPAKVAGVNLTLAANQDVNVTAPIAPDALRLRTAQALTLTSALADNLRPLSSLAIHAGSDGEGDLLFGPGVVLRADDILLRAGDGIGGDGTTARVDALGQAPEFQQAGAGTGNPESFALRQDAAVTDAETPAASQFGDGNLSGVDYTLRSDDEAVTVSDASKVEDSKLSLFARDGIFVEPTVNVRRSDLGGLESFEVDQTQHVDHVNVTGDPDDGGRVVRVFRAGLAGSGTLSFLPPGAAAGDPRLVIPADEVRLIASNGRPGGGTGAISLPGPESLVFVGPTGDLATSPDTFVLRQDGGIVEDDLPQLQHFGGGFPTVQAVRSDESAVDLSDLSRADNAQLILEAARVTVSSDDGDDLDFAGLPGGSVEIRADDVALEATHPDPENAAALPVVDASANLTLAGFDAEADDALAPAAATSPSSVSIRQDDSLTTADSLPDASAFLGGLVPTDPETGEDLPVGLSLRSVHGGILVNSPAKVAGADLSLELESPGDDATVPGRTIDFALGGSDLQVNSLEAVTVGDLALGTDTVIDATGGSIFLQSGSGGSGDLSFANGVELRARSVGLIAGDDVDSQATGKGRAHVDARNALFVIADPDADDDAVSQFFLLQDASIAGDKLPAASQFPNGLDQIEQYVLQSNEGSVTVPDLSALMARNLQVIATLGHEGRAPSVKIESAADLAFDDPVFESVQLTSPKIVLEALQGRVRAESDVLSLSSGSGLNPSKFVIRQRDDLLSADTLPTRGQFRSDPTGIDYKLVSTAGDVRIAGAAADRVEGTNLDLRAAGNLRLKAKDLQVASLSADAGDGMQIRIGSSGDPDELRIQSSGEQRYLDPVELRQDAVLRGASVDLQRDVDSFQDGGSALRVRSDGLVRFRRDVGEQRRLRELTILPQLDGGAPLVEFGGGGTAKRVVRATGDIAFDPDGRDLVPTTTTVGSRNDKLVLDSSQGDVVMGRNEKLSVDGTLRIRAAGRTQLGDVNARRLVVRTDELDFVRRSAGDVAGSGGGLAHDGGVDLVANEFDIQARVLGDAGRGEAPAFGVPNPNRLPAFLAALPPRQRYAVLAIDTSLSRLGERDFARVGDALPDLRPGGPSRADMSFANFAPGARPARPPATALRVARPATLEEIGIEARQPTPGERLARLEGDGVYDDLRGTGIAEPRLRAEPAREALQLYRQVFGPERAHAPRIRELLQGAVDDYRSENPNLPVIGFEFRRWVKNRPSSQFAAFQILESLDALFRAHRNTGIPPAEYERIQKSWLRDIQPEGISLDQLSEAVYPSRYVRGSDILDIFGR
jgi:filamentous hemagglutinin family protein